MKITLIAACADNNVIGNGPTIPWKVTGEQALFKRMTVGKTLLMGSTTYEGIGHLPDRRLVVVSRSRKLVLNPADTTVLFPSIPAALYWAKNVAGLDELVVVGGGSIYEQMLPFADDIFLTRIHIEPEGDVFFPEIPDHFNEVISSEIESNERYTFHWYRRDINVPKSSHHGKD